MLLRNVRANFTLSLVLLKTKSYKKYTVITDSLKLNQQNEPQLFNIGECLDETLGNKKESASIILKSKQPITVNIDFKGMSLQSLGGIKNVSTSNS